MRCGLIGEKLSHSHSPLIHQMLGNYGYELISLSPPELETFFRDNCLRGFNVTIPYKKTVIPYCKELHGPAEKTGCVNTVVRDRNGAYHGYNTDYPGFLYMCRRAGINLKNKKVLVLGSGGTSLTVSAVAADEGAGEIITVSRSGGINYDNIHSHKNVDIIINTTPVGMYPGNGESLVDPGDFPNCSGVIDVIYNPLKTRLVMRAEAMGIPCSGGLPMLIAQAKYASEIFTGSVIDDSRIEEILTKLYKLICNVILIGMPGSGKTEVGKLVAKALGREFIDIDSMIVESTGMSIPEIFEKCGENRFRELEADVIGETGKLSGKVIATGGGSVLLEENRLNLSQNGLVFFLKRDLDMLYTEGRPLSKSPEALREMYRIREPLYLEMCDAETNSCSSLEQTAGSLLEVFHAYPYN
jgi:shikimate dehydrogenase